MSIRVRIDFSVSVFYMRSFAKEFVQESKKRKQLHLEILFTL